MLILNAIFLFSHVPNTVKLVLCSLSVVNYAHVYIPIYMYNATKNCGEYAGPLADGLEELALSVGV